MPPDSVAAPKASTGEILTVRGLNVSYGLSKVLFGIDLSVRQQ